MREPTYFILAALLDGPQHGYGIVKSVERRSDGRLKLAAGTLYGALERLTAEGVVALDREQTVDGRVRRYYRLTDSGAQAVHAEARRMAQAAALVIGPPEGLPA